MCHSGAEVHQPEPGRCRHRRSRPTARRWSTRRSLNNIALTAPYLHDGSARTLEEIWTVFNPNDQHGVTNDLSKDELNDLIEYLKTL